MEEMDVIYFLAKQLKDIKNMSYSLVTSLIHLSSLILFYFYFILSEAGVIGRAQHLMVSVVRLLNDAFLARYIFYW